MQSPRLVLSQSRAVERSRRSECGVVGLVETVSLTAVCLRSANMTVLLGMNSGYRSRGSRQHAHSLEGTSDANQRAGKHGVILQEGGR